MSLSLERPLAFFDLETTGVRIGKDRIVQIGIVRLMPDGQRETLPDPGQPRACPSRLKRRLCTASRDADVADAPALGGRGHHHAGRTGGLRPCRLQPARVSTFRSWPRSCTVWEWNGTQRACASWMCSGSTTRWSHATSAPRCKYYCGREHEGAHDALADVEATADVLLAQLERYGEALQGTVEFLGELSGDRQRSPDAAGKLRFDDQGNVCLSFGKYQGWTLENIGRNDPGYLQWLMTKAELPGSTLSVMRNALADLSV